MFLPLMLLVLGFVLLVIELCIPGFGLLGILGIVLSVIALYWLQPAPPLLLAIIAVYVLLLVIALLLWMRRLSKKGKGSSRLVLQETATPPAAPDAAPAAEELERYVGRHGIAQTPLRPAGIAEFDGIRLDVQTEGDFLPAETPLQVLRIQGHHIVVAPCEDSRPESSPGTTSVR